MNTFLLDFLSVGAIISGILVITSRSPVISVLFLISVFVNVAGYLVLLGVGFIGISYIVVYVGAVTVLFLFVIMIINVELSELNAAGSEYTQNVPLAFIIGSVFFYELFSLVPMQHQNVILYKNEIIFGINKLNLIFANESYKSIQEANVNILFNPYPADITFAPITGLQVQSIGSILYTHGAFWLIVASIILLLAMIAPITLSSNK